MGEKDSKNEGEKKGDGEKKDDGTITVVLKVDMHCDGCVKKIKSSVKRFEGVEHVQGDSETNKLTVKGKVDPAKLRERVELKTKKKVELISPQPAKKDKDGGGDDKKKSEDKSDQKKGEEKKKEPQVSTVALKIRLHCEGCTKRILKIIGGFKGVQTVHIDTQKDLVTISGTMDMKSLQPSLKEKLKRSVDIVPPKKEGDKKGGGEEKKAKEGGGGGEGAKKEKGGDGEKKAGGGDGGKESVKAEGNKLEHYGYGNGYGYPYPYGNGNGYVVEHVHAPQIFSDENPNACSIM